MVPSTDPDGINERKPLTPYDDADLIDTEGHSQPLVTSHAKAAVAILDDSSARGRGAYEIAVGADDRLIAAPNKAPARLIWTTPAAGDPRLGVLGWLAGGMTGGDRLEGHVDVREGGRLTLISQAAEKIYRAIERPAVVRQRFEVATTGQFEFLPSECILFDGANLERDQAISAQGDAQFLVGDMVVFGREAHGEVFTRGRLWDKWSVEIDGELVFRENLLIDERSREQLAAPFGFAGRHYSGLVMYRGPVSAELMDCIREQNGDACLVGASEIDGLVFVRLLATGSIPLRRAFERVWRTLRERLGFSDRLPRLWYV